MVARKNLQAYMASCWVTECPSSSAKHSCSRGAEKQQAMHSQVDASLDTTPSSPQSTHAWTLSCWSWASDGSFDKDPTRIDIYLDTSSDDDEVEIRSLKYFPLRFADEKIRAKLERRGRVFWKCRSKSFVAYRDEESDELDRVIIVQCIFLYRL
jgi:hypothetical protein